MSRRSQAACDACRVRKIRCDSDDRPAGQPCSRCLISELECKFTYKRKKRKPNVTLRQDAKLPDSAPALIEEILSSPDSYIPPSDPATVRDIILSLARYARSIQSTISRNGIIGGDSTLGRIPSSSPQQDSSPPTEFSSSEDESLSDGDGNSETFNQLSLGHSKARHFGKSSNFRFMHSALGLAKENQSLNLELDLARFRRPQYWGTEIWDLQPDPSPIYTFPEIDLLWVLIRDYFHYMGPYIPILHRQTFENGVIHGWHRIDQNFGAIVLAVCAIAARFTDDPRVLLQDTKLAAGWQYFRQIRLVRSNFVEPASIFELQMYCLACVYLHHTNMADSTWTIVGLALRLAFDRGMHRLKVGNGRTAESELCIRVFWLLRGFDIAQGMTLGRMAAVSSDDFDLDEPVECDDEFWEKAGSTEAFTQPVGKISTLCFFTRYNKLMEIAGSVQKIIYGIKPPGSSSSQTSPVERIRQKVMEHDSALNDWLASLPNHLRWDPHQPNETWLIQAVILHITFVSVISSTLHNCNWLDVCPSQYVRTSHLQTGSNSTNY
ncbi:fungal-specific transcription factor domain-containing protein [Rhodocollybia butyracea]|uniref:Fungal-specific transcription factor domain-containing protein n=1 Tax=Rhodocollybia butyracea TaxID=206335 RepID=A0A9P5U5A0_9AGAR|nr:fungal-specific transcription factor domain-containing protein [Rhodocollybia butyracea]